MRLEPVVAHAVVDHQAHLEGGGGFHAFGDDGRDALLFGTEHVDDQFVVYLKDHLRPDAFGRETGRAGRSGQPLRRPGRGDACGDGRSLSLIHI